MSTNDNTEGVTGSLAELFHLVGRLVPDGQHIVAAPPNMTVAEAIQIMSDHNFTQLPVVAGKAVLGVFSFRSLAQRLLRMRQVPEEIGDLPVDEFVEQFQFVQPWDNWESILKYLDREDGALVGHRDQLEAILTRWMCSSTCTGSPARSSCWPRSSCRCAGSSMPASTRRSCAPAS